MRAKPDHSTGRRGAPAAEASLADRFAALLMAVRDSDRELRDGTWRVALAMVLFGANQRGLAFPRVETLANATGMSPSAVKGARARLTKLNVLRAIDAKGGRGRSKGGRSRSATYEVMPNAHAGDYERLTRRAPTVSAAETVSPRPAETVPPAATDTRGKGGDYEPERVAAARSKGGGCADPESEGTRREPPLPPATENDTLSAEEPRVARELRLRDELRRWATLAPFDERALATALARDGHDVGAVRELLASAGDPPTDAVASVAAAHGVTLRRAVAPASRSTASAS